MDTITLDELRRVLADCAGGDGQELAGDIQDVSFEDLGYDSLAVIETTSLIKQKHGVAIPDDEIADLRTPRELLERVNARADGGGAGAA